MPMPMTPRLWIAILGAGGFLALLIVAPFVPPHADEVRVGALAWFLAFGVYEMVWRARDRHRR
jgi:peptidoglycan/LPS O-acetylase OafA/YrhL